MCIILSLSVSPPRGDSSSLSGGIVAVIVIVVVTVVVFVIMLIVMLVLVMKSAFRKCLSNKGQTVEG